MITKEAIETFIFRINDFGSLSPTRQAEYFIYFLTINNITPITVKDILDCYDKLDLVAYSNIPQLLSMFCKISSV